MQFENSFDNLHTFSNLYKIDSAELMPGDSGSPILNSDETMFVRMNIGGGVSQDDSKWYQYGHEWSFLKERMELKD